MFKKAFWKLCWEIYLFMAFKLIHRPLNINYSCGYWQLFSQKGSSNSVLIFQIQLAECRHIIFLLDVEIFLQFGILKSWLFLVSFKWLSLIVAALPPLLSSSKSFFIFPNGYSNKTAKQRAATITIASSLKSSWNRKKGSAIDALNC